MYIVCTSKTAVRPADSKHKMTKWGTLHYKTPAITCSYVCMYVGMIDLIHRVFKLSHFPHQNLQLCTA